MTKERPILFSSEMVQAILDGRKTQTRRIVKPEPHAGVRWSPVVVEGYGGWTDGHGRPLRGRYGAPGDRLWVKETWRTAAEFLSQCTGPKDICYRASASEFRSEFGPKWRPSIFMPRWASRITLEITEVRAQRLQNISPADAESEGVACVLGQAGAIAHFRQLWNRVNGPQSWDMNPWVWAISFRRVQ